MKVKEDEIRERLRILALGPPTSEELHKERHVLVSALFARGLTPEQEERKAWIEAELDRRDGPMIEDMTARHERKMRSLDRLHARIEALLKKTTVGGDQR